MFLITFLLLWQNTKATKERNHVGLMILEGEPMTIMSGSMVAGREGAGNFNYPQGQGRERGRGENWEWHRL